MISSNINITAEDTNSKLVVNNDFLTSTSQKIKSERHPYRVPVFKLSQQNIKYSNDAIKKFSKVRIKSCEFIPKFYNITYQNNCFRWLRKVELGFNEKLITEWISNKGKTINPYVSGSNYPADQWNLCTIHVNPNYYETIDQLVDELNDKIGKSVETLFGLDITEVSTIPKAGLNYEVVNDSVYGKINDARVIDAVIKPMVSNYDCIYMTDSIMYTLDGVTSTIENAKITFAKDNIVDNIRLGSCVINNPEFDNNEFTINNTIDTTNKKVYDSILKQERNGTNSIQEAFLTNFNCRAMIESETLNFDEPKNIIINAAYVKSYPVYVGLTGNEYKVITKSTENKLKVIVNLKFEDVKDVFSYKLIQSGTVRVEYYEGNVLYAYEGVLIPDDIKNVYDDLDIEYRITKDSNIFDEPIYEMQGEVIINDGTEVGIANSPDLGETINLYCIYVGSSTETKFKYGNLTYIISSRIKTGTGSYEDKPGVYTYMNTLAINDGLLKTGTLTSANSSKIIEEMITYDNSEQNLSKTNDYIITKNVELLYDNYFNDLIDIYTNQKKFIELDYNYADASKPRYKFGFKLLPVSIDIIYPRVEDYTKTYSYNTDEILTKLLPKIIEYNDNKYELTRNFFTRQEYSIESSVIDSYLYNFTQIDDLSYNMGLVPIKLNVNDKTVPNYNLSNNLDVIENEQLLDEVAYMIKGRYYSECLYAGPMYTQKTYSLKKVLSNNRSSTIYNLSEPNIDLSMLFADEFIYNSFVTNVHYSDNTADLSLPKKINVLMTLNYDVEQLLNSSYEESSTSLGSYELQSTETLNSNISQKINMNVNVTIPENEPIYVYITGNEYSYALMNLNAVLDVEYIN